MRRKADANKQHVIDFTDNAGRPAKITWSKHPREILPLLPSLCFYFVHPDFSLDDLNLTFFWRDLGSRGGDPFRFELFCIPSGSDADCAQNYRDELEAQGDVFKQVREAEKLTMIPNTQLREWLRASCQA
jgi:hypothetical protein